MRTIEEFYAAAAERFTPGGPGRVDWHMTDSEIVQMLRVTNPGYEKTGALFVIPTPAGIVAIKPIEAAPELGWCADCESTDVELLRPGGRETMRLRCCRCGARWTGVRCPISVEDDLSVEDELRPGRHDRGYARSNGRWRSAANAP